MAINAYRSAINGEPLALLGDSSKQINNRLEDMETNVLLVTQLLG